MIKMTLEEVFAAMEECGLWDEEVERKKWEAWRKKWEAYGRPIVGLDTKGGAYF